MVRSLLQIPGKRHIVVAGEMLELGPSGEQLHADSGRLMGESGVDFVVGVRGLARHIVDAASARSVSAEFVATPEEAGEWMRRNLEAGDVVLLKASRGVRLERALETWMGKAVGSSH